MVVMIRLEDTSIKARYIGLECTVTIRIYGCNGRLW